MVTDNLRTPLLILASPRTGSTALGQYFLKQFPTATYFPEPDWIKHDPSVMGKFTNNIQSKDYDFIVKILYYCMKWYSDDIRNFLLSPATSKIRLRRRDTVSQMASLYVAMYRNWTYHYLDKSALDIKEIIPVKDDQNMDWVVSEILTANRQMDECDLKFDLDLYYEDLPSLDETGFNKTPLPLNYEDIKSVFAKKLNR